MRFFGDGAVGHGAGFEAFDDAGGWLDLAQRNCLCLVKPEPEQTAQRMRQQFIVDHGGVPAEARKITGADGLLQRQDGHRIIHMIFHIAAGAELVEAGGINSQIDGQIHRVKRPVMPPDNSVVHLLQADAADAADRVCEIPVHDIPADADGLKNLCALIRLHTGNAHFGCDPHHTVQNGLIIGIDRGIVVLVERPFGDELADAVLCEIGIDRACAVAEERSEMVHVARLGALKDQGDRRALFRADKILLHGGHCQQRRDGDVVLIHTAVGENEDICPGVIRLITGNKQPVERKRKRGILIIQQRDLLRLKSRHMKPFDLHEIPAGQNGIVDLQDAAVFRAVGKKIAAGTCVDGRVSNDGLAQRVDRRVRDLRKHLLEVIEQRLMLF